MPDPLLRLLVVTPTRRRGGADESEPALRDRLGALADAVDGRAHIEVARRASSDAIESRDGIVVRDVADGMAPVPSWNDSLPRLAAAVKAASPDIVLVESIALPGLVAALRDACGSRVRLVTCALTETPPPSDDGWLGAMTRRRWSAGLDYADAVSFASASQRARWIDAGLFRRAVVLPPMPAAPGIRPVTRDDARVRTGLSGTPLVLWIGAFTDDDDPMAALTGFEAFQVTHPDARLAMVGAPGPLEDRVRGAMHRSLVLQLSTRLLPPVSPAALPDLLHSAHVFLSTDRLGSGPHLHQAMVAGLIPVIRRGPPDAVPPGTFVATWTPDETGGCGRALGRAWDAGGETASTSIRAQAAAMGVWRPFADGLLALCEANRRERPR